MENVVSLKQSRRVMSLRLTGKTPKTPQHPSAASRGGGSSIRFSASEFRKLQQFYTQHVMSGVWRDYSLITAHRSMAFAMFRHTTERPSFILEKTQSHNGHRRWMVFSFKRRLGQAINLEDALRILRRHIVLQTDHR